jgi:ABC-type nitrate/sulfonate/bicarbonate transport system substrate-binding protein
MTARHARLKFAIGPKLAPPRRLISAASLVLLASHPAAALDQVSMQLKWKHQFQFAGYYAALEQGFYRDAGLDVTIRESRPDIDTTEAVASGKANLGVCSANVLREQPPWHGAGRGIHRRSDRIRLIPGCRRTRTVTIGPNI